MDSDRYGSMRYILALCLIIPAASRFSFGLLLSAALCWTAGCLALIKYALIRLPAGELGFIAEVSLLTLSASIFDCLSSFVFPVPAQALSFYTYLTAALCVMLQASSGINFSKNAPEEFGVCMRRWLRYISSFSAFILAFSLIRELLGMGCVSVPAPSGLLSFKLPPSAFTNIFRFFASSGGALILLGSYLALCRCFKTNIAIAKRKSRR